MVISLMAKCILVLAACLLFMSTVQAEEAWRFKDEFFGQLVKAVPSILKTQAKETGRFGSGIWIVTDQNVLFPLAVAWATERPDNPYYHSEELLKAIISGGDALIDDMDKSGRWEFRKKDGSTWGPIYMPWTYSRWIRAYGLVREAMSAEDSERWDRALLLGYEGISKTCLGSVHNIPTHHAMGLYRAGQVFDKSEWRQQAKDFMSRVVKEQNPGGYWSEHLGPVVTYNFVYSDSLGAYYSMSRDETVLSALKLAALFHAGFTYPDGSKVETVDERNPYHGGVTLGTVGFTFSPEGRGFLKHQYELLKKSGRSIGVDDAAEFFLYGEEGPVIPPASEREEMSFILGDSGALVRREGPWFICLSAFTCPVPPSRWIQDRQSYLSIYHDAVGLILGGGNTKLQPLWSTFTVGDISLLSHKPGDETPKFTPNGELYHVASSAKLIIEPTAGLELTYGPESCSVKVETKGDQEIWLTFSATTKSGLPAPQSRQAGLPVAAHLTLLPHIGETLKTGGGKEVKLSEEAISLPSEQLGGRIEYHKTVLDLPSGASLVWPALPHNPYRKDGHAGPAEGRVAITLPFDAEAQSIVVKLRVLP